MKIVRDWQGSAPTPADYALLKAALIAAQSATPTVAGARRDGGEHREALEQIFSGLLPAADLAVAIAHRFAATPLPEGSPKPDDMVDKS